jgi:hypothetical protein
MDVLRDGYAVEIRGLRPDESELLAALEPAAKNHSIAGAPLFWATYKF